MKKVLLVLSGLMIMLCLCACGSQSTETSKKNVDINPADLVTVEDVALNAGYTPVIDEQASGRQDNVATVLYRSNPIGKNDTVTVKITQSTDTVTEEDIKQKFEKDKEKRPSAKPVANLGQDAYIAFPTIHVYDKGCLLEITAGSGSDDKQENMLKNLAITAVGRLESIL